MYLGRLIEPVAYLAFMIVGLNTSVNGITDHGQSVPYGLFAMPGIFALLGARAGIGAMTDFSNDRKWGVFAFARSANVSPGRYLVSLVLAALPMCYIQCLLVTILAVLVIPGTPVLTVSAVACLVVPLIVAAWICLGAALGAAIQSYSQRDMVASLTTLPLILSAPLFFSMDGAPIYLKVLSWINPLTYQVDFLRGLVLGRLQLVDAVICLAILVVSAALGLILLHKAEWLTVER
jgi:ABC-2 type transport system permease protein